MTVAVKSSEDTHQATVDRWCNAWRLPSEPLDHVCRYWVAQAMVKRAAKIRPWLMRLAVLLSTFTKLSRFAKAIQASLAEELQELQRSIGRAAKVLLSDVSARS